VTSHEQRTLDVLVFIQEHLDEVLPLERLARVAHYSPYHVHRIFRGLVGETVAEHIRRLRLERAAFRLMHTNQAILPMALEAGYDSHEAFTRAFGTAFGMPPSAFRERHRPAWHAPTRSPIHYAPEGAAVVALCSLESPDPIRIGERAEQRALFRRHTGPYLEAISTWQALLQEASDRGLRTEGRMAGICHDDPAITAPEHLRYDACLLVDGGEKDARPLFGGTFATFRHEGSYEPLVELYERYLGGWLPRSAFEVRDTPCIEIYGRSALDGAAATDWVTDICVPIVRAS